MSIDNDSIIRVNRSARPVYPDWVTDVLHEDLELSGPSEYDISTVQQWYRPKQNDGIVEGNAVYKLLKDGDMIKDQLGLADLLAIQAKGIAFFRKYFSGKGVFGWRSVVRNKDQFDNLRVPYLIESGDEVVLLWDWPILGCDSIYPALRFASK
jgi:hypothetical protein